MGERQPRRSNYTYGPDDIQVYLVFYSTFKPVDLPGPAGAAPWKLWACRSCTSPPSHPRPSSVYVGPVTNVQGRVPLMPLFLLGNSTPTIPHQLRQHTGRRSRFPHGLADTADASSKEGSNVYELKQWLWEFGRGKPRLGGLSVTATEERRIAVAKGGAKKALATRVRRSHKAPKAARSRGGME